jgi:glycosyltransferase involved in cell wall biosynthesis
LNLALASRTVWMSRNVIPLLPYDEWELSDWDRARLLGMRTLVSSMARHARAVICVSEHARQRLAVLADIPVDRIAVVQHGVTLPPEVAPLQPLGESSYVLYVGQAIPYRRTRELFAAYRRLASRAAGVPPLWVVGKAKAADEPYERECRAILEPLERSGKARWLGQRAHREVLELLSSAHAFVYPSVHEDCPNVVLEALAAGRPSVLADIPAVRELAQDAAVCVADPGESSLASELERVIFDQGLRERLSAESRRRAGLFSWERTIERTAHVLESAFARLPS